MAVAQFVKLAGFGAQNPAQMVRDLTRQAGPAPGERLHKKAPAQASPLWERLKSFVAQVVPTTVFVGGRPEVVAFSGAHPSFLGVGLSHALASDLSQIYL